MFGYPRFASGIAAKILFFCKKIAADSPPRLFWRVMPKKNPLIAERILNCSRDKFYLLSSTKYL